MPNPRKRQPDRGMPVDLRALESFLAVLDTGSMTAAAARLGLTQPAISAAIRQLETQLGSRLIDRETRPLRPTRAGAVLHHRAIRLLNDANGLRSAVQLASDRMLPRMRIGLVVSATVTGAPMIRALQGMADELSVSSGLTPELARGLVERDLDILITSDPMEDVEGLERHRVLHEPFILALPGDYRPPAELSLRSLAAGLPLIRYTHRSIIGMIIERHLRRSRVDAPSRLVFDSSASVLAMVAAGLGWAITTPLCVVQGETDLAMIQVLPLPGASLTRDLYVVARQDELPGAAERIRDLATELTQECLARAFSGRVEWIMKALEF